MSDYDTGDKSIESFANRLFDTWRIGDRATNKGVLLLVAVKDRKVRIELGKSYRDLYDARMKEIIDQHILPAFKRDDYSRGILQGTQAIAKVLSGAPVLDPPRTPVKASASRPGESIWEELVIWFVSLDVSQPQESPKTSVMTEIPVVSHYKNGSHRDGYRVQIISRALPLVKCFGMRVNNPRFLNEPIVY